MKDNMFNILKNLASASSDKDSIVLELQDSFAKTKELYNIVHQNAQLSHDLSNLKQYQQKRLAHTHADYLIDPNTSQAANFFLTDIYGDNDFSNYYKDLDKLIPTMTKTFPAPALEIIVKSLKLNLITEQLDLSMAQKLGSQFTDEQYWKLYKSKDTLSLRKQQLLSLKEIGDKLISISKLPLISQLLNVMSIPAKKMNVLPLHNFLKNGFNIFKNTKEPEKFLNTLYQRELDLLIQ